MIGIRFAGVVIVSALMAIPQMVCAQARSGFSATRPRQAQGAYYQRQVPQRTAQPSYRQQWSGQNAQCSAPVKAKKTRSLGPFAKTVVSLSDAFDPYAKTVLPILAVPCLIFILIARRRGEGYYCKRVARMSIGPGIVAVIYGIFIDDWSMTAGERFVQVALLLELVPILYSCWAVSQMSGGVAYKIFAFVMLLLVSFFSVLLSALTFGIGFAVLIAMTMGGGFAQREKNRAIQFGNCFHCKAPLFDPECPPRNCPGCGRRLIYPSEIIPYQGHAIPSGGWD